MRVGDKAKGFKYDGTIAGITFGPGKERHVGEEGTVTYIFSDFFEIKFGNESWIYPLELAHLAKVDWIPERGEMIEVSADGNYYSCAEFVTYVEGISYPYAVLSVTGSFITSYKFARPIDPTQRKIDELEKQIAELKKTL